MMLHERRQCPKVASYDSTEVEKTKLRHGGVGGGGGEERAHRGALRESGGCALLSPDVAVLIGVGQML